MGKFKAKDHTGGIKPVPIDTYVLALVKAERKESTNSPGNYYSECRFIITAGEYAKRSVIERFNLENSSETAQEIGQNDLRELMAAIDGENAQLNDMWDLTSLMNKEFKAKVGIEESEQYGDKNIIVKFIPKEPGEPKSKKKKEKKGDSEDPWEKELAKKDKKKKKKGKKKK